MSLRTVVLAGAVTVVGLGGFLLLQTTSVTNEGKIQVGHVPVAAAQCTDPDSNRCLPAIKDKDITGADVNGRLAGKAVMVNFFAPWCEPCLEEMPALEQVFEKHQGDLVILGIVFDEASDAAAQAFAKSHGLTYPIIRANRELESAFGRPQFFPTSKVYDRSGHLVTQWSRGVDESQLEHELAPALHAE